MPTEKNCFFNADRPCDLTCKAAFEVDDPVDNIDCHFVWLSYHAGEVVYELKRVLEGFGGGPGTGPGSEAGAGPFGKGGPGPFPGFGGGKKPPKGPSDN